MTELDDGREFEALLEYLKRTRGFDFTAYKRPSLMRRVQKRMQAVNIERFGDYTDYLEVHPEEFAQLFNMILINVTSFLRDEGAWDFLRTDVLPAMLQSRARTEPVRVWTAACASGEETYSIAMLLAEALGPNDFRDRVKIYATDADEQALNQARAAAYTEAAVQGVPPAWLERYFTRENERFVFDRDLRRSVIFGRHDLIQDAPISRVNLLICRNTLMYFNTEAQSRILARFHFALAEGGILFLGKAEMLLTHTQMFAPIDLRRRIFRKLSKDNWRDRLAIMNQASSDEPFSVQTEISTLLPAMIDASPHPQIVVDADGLLALYNERARVLFSLAPSDVGRPVQDIDLLQRSRELRTAIEQALAERRTAVMKDVEWEAPGGPPRVFDITIAHLPANGNGGTRTVGISVTFTDTSRARELQQQLNGVRQDLETASEELQSTNEELETTNEELQSTVEELETTNEELQSTNEELQTINDELRRRSDELKHANGFLESVLTGVRSGVVVLDRELHVIAWNHRAEDLWGLRADEVRGQNFMSLDIGLPADQLRGSIRASLAGDASFGEVSLPATNRRGKPILCKVTSTPLASSDGLPGGVILMMEEQAVTASR